jgi:hypothetical protein
VVFYLRAVEQIDGCWVGKRGRAVLGTYATLDEALAVLEQLSNELDGDFEVRVHPLAVSVTAP